MCNTGTGLIERPAFFGGELINRFACLPFGSLYLEARLIVIYINNICAESEYIRQTAGGVRNRDFSCTAECGLTEFDCSGFNGEVSLFVAFCRQTVDSCKNSMSCGFRCKDYALASATEFPTFFCVSIILSRRAAGSIPSIIQSSKAEFLVCVFCEGRILTFR